MSEHPQRQPYSNLAIQVLDHFEQDPQPIRIEISKTEAVLLHAELQLALRHPANCGAGSSVARQVCQAIKESLGAWPPAKDLLESSEKATMDQLTAIRESSERPIRPVRELQAAHAILEGILSGDTPLEPNALEREAMGRTLETICWVLMHGAGQQIETSLFNIRQQLREQGYTLARRSDETAADQAQGGTDAQQT
jgi:hypothetical protein